MLPLNGNGQTMDAMCVTAPCPRIADEGASDVGLRQVQWATLGGRAIIEQKILDVWYVMGFTTPPIFTSGFRSVTHNAQSHGVPQSLHTQGLAFDLRNRWMTIEERDDAFQLLTHVFAPLGIQVIRHAELDHTPRQHFHFEKEEQ